MSFVHPLDANSNSCPFFFTFLEPVLQPPFSESAALSHYSHHQLQLHLLLFHSPCERCGLLVEVNCQQTKLASYFSPLRDRSTFLQVKLINCLLTTMMTFRNMAMSPLIGCRTEPGLGGKSIEKILFKIFQISNSCVLHHPSQNIVHQPINLYSFECSSYFSSCRYAGFKYGINYSLSCQKLFDSVPLYLLPSSTLLKC